MTVAFSSKRRRAVATLGAVSVGLLALSACDKPTPVATVTVGSNSVHTQASCYNDGKKLEVAKLQGCLQDKDLKTVKVDPDAMLHIGVDPDIADKGWTLLIDGQQKTESSKKTFWSATGGQFFQQNQQTGATPKTATISIVSGTGAKVTGLWSFKLQKDA
ncbi:DUF2771 domain-containing protein [Streptomyces beijiangensis]|uniref:DUF2771 domain-containing protein n=1 Tax=Streptomyces beijiangensis TaxID=163361 RepID=A0A939F9W6_9ACTN|nr:DUF2771 domain-containing protein [Streptomyces beijiangensis]MBO0515316.1 DUF2771 domain-containing protein [Streptomyces beijiangensis]